MTTTNSTKKANIATLPPIAMVQMEIKNDPLENAERFIEKATQAVKQGAKIIAGPEMMIAPYVSGDRYEDDAFIDEMQAATMHIVAGTKDIDAVVIFGGVGLDPNPQVVGEDGRRRKYNAAFVVQNGVLIENGNGLPFAVKSLHPNYRIFDDARHFFCLRKVAMERGVVLESLLQPFRVTIDGETHDLGVMLCEDMWDLDYAEKPAELLSKNGADVLINLSCSNWSWRKNQKRDQVIKDICVKTGLPFVYVNSVGVQNNGKNYITFDGASTAYSTAGVIVAMAALYEEEMSVVNFATDTKTLERHEPDDTEQMFTAVEIATRGFVSTLPQRLQKCLVAVSGGKDSAATLALMVHILGAENVLGLTMPVDGFTSDETKNDAVEQCVRLGVECLVVPIGDMVRIKATAAGIEPGTSAYKTIQAMERMTTHAAIAAERGYFFTSNANMLESAFGYTTLNADSRGVFAPWGNCLAQDVYRMLDHMNRTVLKGKILPSIIDRAPTDELSDDQRPDPFFTGRVKVNGYHDQMVRAMVAFRRSASWFVSQYKAGTLEAEMQLEPGTIDGHFETPEAFVEDLERCFNLFHNAVYKRVQSVPCPLVDKRTFGWDLRESVLPWVQTSSYAKLKATLLGG